MNYWCNMSKSMTWLCSGAQNEWGETIVEQTFPMFPDGISPKPPMRPAHISKRISPGMVQSFSATEWRQMLPIHTYSPYKFGITITQSEYGAGSFMTLENLDTHINFQHTRYQSYLQANMIKQVFIILDIREILWDFQHASRKRPSDSFLFQI